jgi:signal transduction histidine kinase
MFTSRVALRIFLLFGLCALLPITAQAVLSFNQVTTHLQEQTRIRLQQSVKSLGMAVLERLLLYDAVLDGIAVDVRSGAFLPAKNQVQEAGEAQAQARFLSLALLDGNGTTLLHGSAPPPPLSFLAEERRHLGAGKSVLKILPDPSQTARLVLVRVLDPAQPDRGLLAGEINGGHLWRIISSEFLVAGREACILDYAFNPVVCTNPGPPPPSLQAALRQAGTAVGHFEWTQTGAARLANFWSLPLQFAFAAPQVFVVLSESRSTALAFLTEFKTDFILIMLTSLTVVVLLSLNQIRKSLGPLEKIREGTRRIALRDFAARVEVSSGDEFEEVAGSFNAMAGRLGRQFQALAVRAEIDRNILSVLDVGKIVDTVLTRMRELLPCDSVNVTLRHAPGGDQATVYLWDGVSHSSVEPKQVTLTDQEIGTLAAHADRLVALTDGTAPSLAPLASLGIHSCLVLPINLTQGLPGLIALGYRTPPALDAEDVAQARQFANQVAVALSNAYETAERKKAEASLQDSNRQLKEALDELASMQRQIVQQERLRALGQMASGVAHDFNNALSPVLGFSSILIEDPEQLDDKEKVLKYLQIINTAGRDAASVVSRLREFYRPRDKQEAFVPFDLNKLVEQSVNLTQPKWKDQALTNGATIRVACDLQPVPPVAGNESEIREVLTNLIFNAVDAMPGGGTITLHTSAQDGRVLLAVGDTGTGMTEEVRQRCLEPFFSTKGDRGTGLGLAMVYGIVRRHKSTIDIQSELEKGTTFTIRFPVEDGPEPQAVQTMEPTSLARALKVLVVDDDPVTLMTTSECVRAERHEVETATDGLEAFARYKSGHFDLVITDQGMPKMNGTQLAAAIKGTGAKTPVIMLTGNWQMVSGGEESSDAVDLVVGKPITRSGIRDAIAKVLKATS